MRVGSQLWLRRPCVQGMHCVFGLLSLSSCDMYQNILGPHQDFLGGCSLGWELVHLKASASGWACVAQLGFYLPFGK
jgi:hypothetical protein